MARPGIIVDAYSTGRHLADGFARHGIPVHHVQSMPEILEFDRPSFQPQDFVANHIHDGSLAALVGRLAPLDPLFVVPGCESGVILADALAEALGLPGNGTALSLARRDKARMADAVAAAGLRAIRHTVTDDAAAAEAWRRRHRLAEVVVKPTDSAGTEDLHFCTDAAGIAAAFATILGKVNAMGRLNDAALVQERIRGRQFTANTLSCRGRHYLGELWTYETVEVPGAGSLCEHERLLDGADPVAAPIRAYVDGVLDALGIAEGPAHIELFVDAAGPVLIELGARLQGSMSRTARLSALGHDHVALMVKRYADADGFLAYAARNDPYRRRRHALIASILSDRAGLVRGHRGLEAVTALDSFADAFAFPPVGAPIAVSRDLASTAGLVYLVNADAGRLEADWQALKSKSISDILDIVPA
jgi:biotin carboxylase